MVLAAVMIPLMNVGNLHNMQHNKRKATKKAIVRLIKSQDIIYCTLLTRPSIEEKESNK
jgi:hypothetical protein